MKAILLTVLILPATVFGQITINVDDFSDGGDATWVSTTQDPSIDFATTGPNTTWDYSSLAFQDQVYKEYFSISSAPMFIQLVFGTFAPTDYAATNYAASSAIPLDQIGGFLPVNITDVFQFSKNSPDSITSVGFAIALDGNDIPFKSDTIETRYKFPMNFGDSYSSRGYTKLDMNPFYNGIWIQYRQRTSVVDGWGSITTPYGTFDALRIDHTIEETDSIYMEVGGFGMWLPLPIPTSHQYEWWAEGQNEPVLRITTNDIIGNETVTNIEYIDTYQGAGAGIDEQDISLKVYPNPTTDNLSIEGLEESALYLIVDANGSQVLAGSLDSNTQIDVSKLPVGSYMCKVITNKRITSIPFVKN